MSAPKKDRIGATRAKLRLVAVLAVILCWVLVRAFSGDAGRQAEATAEGPTAPNSTLAEIRAAAKESPWTEEMDWPLATLEELTGVDPFAGPKMARVAGAARSSMPDETDWLEELKEASGALVFLAGDQKVVRVGTREFRVGEVIDGWKIRDISATGITFEPKH